MINIILALLKYYRSNSSFLTFCAGYRSHYVCNDVSIWFASKWSKMLTKKLAPCLKRFSIFQLTKCHQKTSVFTKCPRDPQKWTIAPALIWLYVSVWQRLSFRNIHIGERYHTCPLVNVTMCRFMEGLKGDKGFYYIRVKCTDNARRATNLSLDSQWREIPQISLPRDRWRVVRKDWKCSHFERNNSDKFGFEAKKVM